MILALTSSCVYLDNNHRVVERGAFHRAGQMSDTALGSVIRRYGIKTVVNLRGVHPEEAWWREEKQVCAALGATHYDLDWSMNRLPEPESLARFVALLDTAERPILAHCQGGTHRAAVAAALYLLWRGEDVDTARRQFGIFFHRARIGDLLTLYETHPAPFHEWVAKTYPALFEELE